MELFNTNSMETVKACQEYFLFELPSIQLGKRKKKMKQNLCLMDYHTLCDVDYEKLYSQQR